MTVTKQQQLEWLAINYAEWPFSDAFVFMCRSRPMEFASRSGIRITRKEWKQEREKMQKQQYNSWHERGEFPPAGCECEVKYHGKWIKTVIIGMSPYNSCVFSLVGHPDSHAYDGMSPASSFRPLRTEREKAIDALAEIICAGDELSKDGSAAREIAERIYEAQQTKEKTK